MNSNINWLKFVISGKAEDYIRYSCSVRGEKGNSGEQVSYNDRCTRDKIDRRGGEGQAGSTPHP